MSAKKELELFFQKFANGNVEDGNEKLTDLNGRAILIYGAGNVGKRLERTLSANNLEIIGFLDKNELIVSATSAPPVLHPENRSVAQYKQDCIVIIAGLFNDPTRYQIKSYLSTLGFVHVYQLYEIDFSKYTRHHYYENVAGDVCRRLNILEDEKSKIFKTFDLLNDEKDQRCFLDYLKAHLTMDFVRLPPPENMKHQYLAPDISHHIKDFSTFIDCGGYDGDTVKNILDHGYPINHLIIFEPHGMLFSRITNYLNREHKMFQSAIALPCAVYSETMPLRFAPTDDNAPTGHLDKSSETTIQGVKIDDVLYGFSPTFIKMDVEGAEYEAIKGAQRIIKKYRPQLAISVYHCLSHIWDIPLFISEIAGNYNFFLRSYNEMTMETVCYAFPN